MRKYQVYCAVPMPEGPVRLGASLRSHAAKSSCRRPRGVDRGQKGARVAGAGLLGDGRVQLAERLVLFLEGPLPADPQVARVGAGQVHPRLRQQRRDGAELRP